jgi:hypothetical protein
VKVAVKAYFHETSQHLSEGIKEIHEKSESAYFRTRDTPPSPPNSQRSKTGKHYTLFGLGHRIVCFLVIICKQIGTTRCRAEERRGGAHFRSDTRPVKPLPQLYKPASLYANVSLTSKKMSTFCRNTRVEPKR